MRSGVANRSVQDCSLSLAITADIVLVSQQKLVQATTRCVGSDKVPIATHERTPSCDNSDTEGYGDEPTRDTGLGSRPFLIMEAITPHDSMSPPVYVLGDRSGLRGRILSRLHEQVPATDANDQRDTEIDPISRHDDFRTDQGGHMHV